VERPGRPRGARLAAYREIASSLAGRSDDELRDLADTAVPLGHGIGGAAARAHVGGHQVFVKLVPLTAVEELPGNTCSTANTFALPAFCHYGIAQPGIGSPGFTAWRELAVHIMTTDWVTAGSFEGFPMLYHWRVLPGRAVPLSPELADVDRAVAYWGGGDEVRRRIEALRQSRSSLALFLEHFPHDLHKWLGAQLQAGGPAGDRACAMVERELEAGTGFMEARGLLHFDAHFENILTDGQRLYFADYGLALSAGFGLSPGEADFFRLHRGYDRYYVRSYLVHWLITALHGLRGEDRTALIRSYALGEPPRDVPAAAAAALRRHAPLAAAMVPFFRGLQQDSRETPYPAEELSQAAAPRH
jgi:hypothetical protein